MLKREAKVVDKQRQKVLRQRKAQQKKDQEERKRAEVLKQKRMRAEERSRREWVRKRMRSDLTMDDILGQKSAIQDASHHQDYYIFSREPLSNFIFDTVKVFWQDLSYNIHNLFILSSKRCRSCM